MSDRTPIPIEPIAIGHDSPEFEAICGWPFADDYVGRVLRHDIPRRVVLGDCRIWIYRDPDGEVVGFGTLEVGEEYLDFTEGRPHPYIPLLAVNPPLQGRGHGRRIVEHLIAEAAIRASSPAGCCGDLFLDVYADNLKAIELYERCGFIKTGDEPRLHREEGDRPYLIMVKNVSAAPI
jgi:ribosomal protein S18 acetylase RimI-like enzyme